MILNHESNLLSVSSNEVEWQKVTYEFKKSSLTMYSKCIHLTVNDVGIEKL